MKMFFFKTLRALKLGAIVTPDKGLEWVLQTDRQTEAHTDRQTQTDRLTDRLTDGRE